MNVVTTRHLRHQCFGRQALFDYLCLLRRRPTSAPFRTRKNRDCRHRGPLTAELTSTSLTADAEEKGGPPRTFTILLSVLRDLSESEIASAVHRYICQTGDPIRGTKDLFRLTPRDRDEDFFRENIQRIGATSSLPDAKQFKDARARMIENAVFLRARLIDYSDEQRRRLLMYIAQRCYLVIVAASDQESAFRIFSVLNSRGLDLSPADVLKAEIIGALPAGKQDAYTQKWEDIEEELGRARFSELFGHIRTIHRKQKMQSTLLAEFRELVPTVITHPYRGAQAAVWRCVWAAMACRMAASAVRPARRAVATMEQRSA